MSNPDHLTILLAANEKPWYMYHSEAMKYLQVRLSQGFQYVLPYVAPLMPDEAVAHGNPVDYFHFAEMERENEAEKKQNEFLIVKKFESGIWCGIDFKTLQAIRDHGRIPLIIVGLSSLDEIRDKCPNAKAVTLVDMKLAARSEASH